MNPFYKLNATLANIGNEQKQIAKEVAKAVEKSPVRKSLEESLRSDMKSLMEGQVNEISQSTKDSYAKKAKTEVDIYNRNKNNPGASAKDKEVAAKSAANREKGLAKVKEDGTGGMNFSGSGSLEEKVGYSAKKAAAGKDIGKPGKNFAKIEKSAAKKYGSKEAGERVAGAVLNKLRHPKESIGQVKEAYNPVKAVKQCAKSYMEMNGIHSVHDLEAEDIESIGGDCQMNYQDVCEILGCNLPDSLGPVKSYDEHGDMEESALQAYLGNKKYGKQGMDALRKAGREHAGKDKMNQIRNRYDKMDEMECDTPVPAKGIPGNVPVKGKMDRLKGKRDYYETDDSDEDIMAYLNRKLASHDKEQAKENAMSKPYNGSKGDADAYNGMEFEGAAMPPPDVPQAAIIAPSPDAKYQVQKPQAPQVKTDMSKIPNDILQKAVDGGYPDANPALIAAAKTELANRMSGASSYNPTVHNPTVKEVSKNGPHGKPGWLIDAEKRAEGEIDETMTRQHFQHTADLLKHIEDPAKRMELARHHAGVFKASNPRFDHGKFMKACNCDEGIAGQAAGTIAGGALGGPVGAAIGGAIGNNLTNEEDFEEGWDDAMAAGKAAANQKPAYSRHTRRDVAPGRAVYTRNLDDEPEDDDDKDAPAHRGGKPRGRGRPVGTKGATGSRGPTGKSKLMARDAIGEENVAEVCHHCGQAIQEKAVSKKQQKFMGMVHAAQKGEKPASKEVAKVAKGMKKKDAEDFASTKHKGLPEKVKSKKTEEGKGDGNLANNAKPYDKVTRGDVVAGRLGKDEEGGKKKFKKEEKVDETTTSGSVTTAEPKASKSNSMGIGQGIYDSWNRSIESMINENINVNTTATKNDDGQDHESLTITVDGDDVGRFKELLQHMGISQNQDNSYKPHSDEPCGTCGGVPCQCEEIADEGVLGTLGGAAIGGALGGPVGAAVGAVGGQELTKGGSGIIEADAPVSQNSPDYPTNQEESDDALQYSGGLNGKKSTGQSTIPVLASQEERQMSESNSFLDLYKAFSKIGK